MLSLDLYVSILEQVPANRNESGALTLVNCLRAGAELREAALVGALWKSHYRVRYVHTEEDSETRLAARCNSNWRLMYAERRGRDKIALGLLRDMTLHREGRYQLAANLASMSFDIWDALEIQCSLPVPTLFGGSTTAVAAPYALTLRFWAEAILDAISRKFAVLRWGRLNETGNSVSFVDAFSSLSCFFGKPPQEMQSQLLALGNACREYLIKHQCRLDQVHSDLPDICTKICEFMHEQGFGAVEPSRFYDISNHFPHLYLTTNKRSIPISLVHIFVSLARHLGISASPVEFPARVLAHVPSPAGSDDFLVDVYASDTKAIVSLRDDVPVMLTRLGIPVEQLHQYISPCGGAPMLLRAARNILASFRNDASRSTAQSAIYAAVCIHLLLTNDVQLVAHMLSHVDLDPLWASTFLADMQPLLRHGGQYQLAKSCGMALEAEEQQAALIHSRTSHAQITHYVGMVFEHRSYHYIGCITGWDASCLATAEWQMNMNVRNLPRGADQPFYHVLSLDGGQRYVAEDNINPRRLTAELALQFFKDVSAIPRFFSDAYPHPDSCRGRWCLSPELKHAYPDDEHFSKIYDEYAM
ncbi:YccV-like-domain-containing protein [Mycena albidolilacea]|uniref:YccV-like-domain-containing protein n=1 Tax=Mycena albidolilacea TaxID=1033008 RepID=A0AAD7AKY4_9AGAR|nr:YccV-like-domain-containing protein [Mycena albidolilacea]